MFKFAPCCGRELEYPVEDMFNSLNYLYCRQCDVRIPIHEPEKMEETDWNCLDRDMFKQAVDKVAELPFCPDRPVLDALRRNEE